MFADLLRSELKAEIGALRSEMKLGFAD